MAKTANNNKGEARARQGAARRQPAQAGKGVAKRADAKPARGRAPPSSASRRRAPAGRERGFGKFLRDVRMELGKVTWPTRKDLMQSTLVVMVAVAIAAVFTVALDLVFSQARRLRRPSTYTLRGTACIAGMWSTPIPATRTR